MMSLCYFDDGHFQKNKCQQESGREDSNGVSQGLKIKLVSFGLSQLSLFHHLLNLFVFSEKQIIIYQCLISYVAFLNMQT